MPGHLIRRAHQISNALFAEECGSYELTSVQYAALAAIDANRDVDATRLSALIAFDRSTIGDVLERLENKGWVQRHSSPKDKRVKLLRLSPNGKSLLLQVQPGVDRVQQRLLACLAPDERRSAIALLSRLASDGEASEGQHPAGTNAGAADDATGPAHMYEDFTVGQKFRSRAQLVTHDRIVAFGAEFDPQPQHISEDAAADSQFGELVASGWHTASVSMRLFVECLPTVRGGLQGGALEELAWPKPVRPGDLIRVEAEVVWKRESRSRLDKGLVKVKAITLNQRDEIVQTATHMIILPRFQAPSQQAAKSGGEE